MTSHLIGVANIPIPGPGTDTGTSPSDPDFGAHTYPSEGDHGAYYREDNPGLETLGQVVVGNDIP